MENKKSKVVKFNFFDWFKKSWSQNSLFSTGMALLVMIILQTIALGFQFDSFGAWFATWANNWINILRNNAGVGIIALGMAFVIISGGIDLAVGSTLVAIGAVLMIIIDCSPNALLASLGISGIPLYIIAIIVALAFVLAVMGIVLAILGIPIIKIIYFWAWKAINMLFPFAVVLGRMFDIKRTKIEQIGRAHV